MIPKEPLTKIPKTPAAKARELLAYYGEKPALTAAERWLVAYQNYEPRAAWWAAVLTELHALIDRRPRPLTKAEHRRRRANRRKQREEVRV